MSDRVLRVTDLGQGRTRTEEVVLPGEAEQIVTRDQSGIGSGEFAFGTLLDYTIFSIPTENEIQYVQVWLAAGDYTAIRIYVASGGDIGSTIKVGIYDLTNDQPDTLLESGSYTLSGSDDGTWVDIPLDSTLTLTSHGFYSVAMSVDTVDTLLEKPQLLSSEVLQGGVHPIWFEDTADGLLNSVASIVEKTQAIFYTGVK